MIFLRHLVGYFLQVLPFAFLCFYPFADHFRFPKKQTNILSVSIIGFLGLLFAAYSQHLANDPTQQSYSYELINTVFIGSLIPCAVWFFYAVKDMWQKKLFIFTFAMTIALFMMSATNTIQIPFPSIGPIDAYIYDFDSLLIILIVTVTTMPFAWIILKRAYKPVSNALNARESTYLVILFALLLMLSTITLSMIGSSSLPTILMLITFMVTMFILYTICFRLFAHAHEKIVAQEQFTYAQLQLELNSAQYERISSSIENTKSARHDMRHNLIALRGLIHSGNSQDAEDYISEQLNTLDSITMVDLCDNPIVNTVVGHFHSLISESGITFTNRIVIPKHLDIQDSDLAVLLGNLLENAIFAASDPSIQDPFIDFNFIASGKMLAITVDNSFDGQVHFENNHYLSTKAPHRGIGLQSIQRIAEKYSGGVDFTYEGNVFHSSVMLINK